MQNKLKQDRETRSMAVPEVTIYNLLLKPQAFSFECLYLKKTTGNLSIYVPQKCPQKVGRETPFTVAVRRHGQKTFQELLKATLTLNFVNENPSI